MSDGSLSHGKRRTRRTRCTQRRRQLGLLLGLLLLTAASLAWSELHPAWTVRSWYVLWALGGASGVLGLRWVCGEAQRRRPALLVALLLALGQFRSLELLLMFLAWSLHGFAP